MVYQILKILVRLGVYLYYSEVKVRNRDVLNAQGPKLIIANHPNTLVDALLIGILSPQPVYYMTKATYFNKKWKKKILRSLKMIPINRPTESKIEGVNNATTLEECYNLLAQGKSLVIFPEGTSYMELLLRPLKTGAARIALEAERRNNGTLKLQVIPVGLIYTQGEKFRSSVMVNFGQGMNVTDYLENYKINHAQTAKQLTEAFKIMLQEVLVTVQNKEHEKLITDLSHVLQSKYLATTQNVESEIGLMRQIRDRIDILSQTNPQKIEEIWSLLHELMWKTKRMEVKNDLLDRRIRIGMFTRQTVTSILGLILASPFFIFGFIHNIIPYLLTHLLILRLKISIEFYAPLAITISAILYPINYVLFFYVLSCIWTPNVWISIFYCISMPLMGFFAYSFVQYLRHISYKLKFIWLVIRNKKAIIELQEQRKELFTLLFQ